MLQTVTALIIQQYQPHYCHSFPVHSKQNY